MIPQPLAAFEVPLAYGQEPRSGRCRYSSIDWSGSQLVLAVLGVRSWLQHLAPHYAYYSQALGQRSQNC